MVPAFHGCGPAGRCEQEPERSEVWMARLLQPKLLLERLCGEFCLRAGQARLRPLELGLQVEGQKYQLELSNCGAAVTCQRGPQLPADEPGRLHPAAVGTTRLGPRWPTSGSRHRPPWPRRSAASCSRGCRSGIRRWTS